MQPMSRSLFRPAWRNAQRSGSESTDPPLTSAPEPYIRHRPTEPWELQRIEAALLIPPDEADTLKAVCAHITQHSGDPSSRALAGLVRALYQDTSSFNFDSLDCLGPLMRRHAERLISARLWSAVTDHEWQQAYAAVAAYEFKDNVAKLANAPKTSPERTLGAGLETDGRSPKTAAEIRAAFEGKAAEEPKPAFDGKAPAEPKSAFEGKVSAEPKSAFDGKASPEPRSAFDSKAVRGPKPSAEPKPGSELRPALEPSPRRDDSRVLAKTHIGSAASTAVAVTPMPRARLTSTTLPCPNGRRTKRFRMRIASTSRT